MIQAPRPWIGFAEEESIVSASGEDLKCSEPRFNEFVCMTLEDYHNLLVGLEWGCTPWDRRSGLTDARQRGENK